jgi:hypothetical protein
MAGVISSTSIWLSVVAALSVYVCASIGRRWCAKAAGLGVKAVQWWASMTPAQRKKVWKVSVILTLACLGLLLPECLRRLNAARTVGFVQPLLASDARFTRVRVWRSKDHAIVAGVVASKADERALRELVQEANPPQQVVFTLEIVPGLQ